MVDVGYGKEVKCGTVNPLYIHFSTSAHDEQRIYFIGAGHYRAAKGLGKDMRGAPVAGGSRGEPEFSHVITRGRVVVVHLPLSWLPPLKDARLANHLDHVSSLKRVTFCAFPIEYLPISAIVFMFLAPLCVIDLRHA